MMQVTLLSDFGEMSCAPEEIVCHAASVSRNSVKKRNLDQMRDFNSKIIKVSGHKSVMEHAHYVFMLEDISRLLAERIGEHRLLSITEQSQRYVDMSDVEFLEGNVFLNMECLDLYREMVQDDIPKEDARYVLPLSTPTTMVISGNARTMEHLCKNLAASKFDEFRRCGEIMFRTLYETSPSLFDKDCLTNSVGFGVGSIGGRPKLVASSNRSVDNPHLREKAFWHAIAIKNGLDLEDGKLDLDEKSKQALVFNEFFKDRNNPGRIFEMIELNFLVSGSSSMYNQMKRHRMMTILPYNYSVNHFVTPLSIQANEKMFAKYSSIVNRSQEFFNQIELSREKEYCLLNCHCRQMMIKMNGRQLFSFYKLRGDSKAQWEIRSIAQNMRVAAKGAHNIIFKHL